MQTLRLCAVIGALLALPILLRGRPTDPGPVHPKHVVVVPPQQIGDSAIVHVAWSPGLDPRSGNPAPLHLLTSGANDGSRSYAADSLAITAIDSAGVMHDSFAVRLDSVPVSSFACVSAVIPSNPAGRQQSAQSCASFTLPAAAAAPSSPTGLSIQVSSAYGLWWDSTQVWPYAAVDTLTVGQQRVYHPVLFATPTGEAKSRPFLCTYGQAQGWREAVLRPDGSVALVRGGYFLPDSSCGMRIESSDTSVLAVQMGQGAPLELVTISGT